MLVVLGKLLCQLCYFSRDPTSLGLHLPHRATGVTVRCQSYRIQQRVTDMRGNSNNESTALLNWPTFRIVLSGSVMTHFILCPKLYSVDT